MAIFNPKTGPLENPVNDPSYLRLSQPISNVEGNKGIATALAGAGNLLEGAVKGVDTVVNQVIDQKLYASVDRDRDGLTTALERIKGELPGGPEGPLGPLNILPEDAAKEMPTRLRKGLQTIQDTEDASEYGGPFNDNIFRGKVLKTAKELRNMFPGWRDRIDQRISEISGMPIANAYYKGLLHDVNRNAQAANSEMNKFVTFLQSSKYPDKAGLYNKVLNGMPIAQARYELYKDSDSWTKIELAQREFEFQERTDKADAAQGEKTFNMQASKIVENNFKNVLMRAGGSTPEEIHKIVQRALSTPGSLPKETAIQLASEIMGNRATADREMEDYGDTPVFSADGKRSKKLRDTMGPTKWNELKQAHLKQMDDTAGYLVKDRVDLAARVVMQTQARVDDARQNIQNNEHIGDSFVLAQVFESAPEFSRIFMRETLMQGFSEKYGRFRAAEAEKMFTINTPARYSQTGNVHVLKDSIENSQRREKQLGTKAPENAEYFLKTLEIVGNPSVEKEQRLSGLYAIFHPRNRGVVAKFEVDGVDPATGQHLQGPVAVFNRLTQQKILQAAWDLRGEDPNIWKYAQSWVLGEFGQAIWKKDIANLSEMQIREGVKLLWDTDKQQWEVKQEPTTRKDNFSVRFPGASDSKQAADVNYKLAVEAAGRMNEGLEGVKRMYNTMGVKGKALDRWLLQTLQAFNFDFAVAKEGTVTKEMMESLMGPGAKNPVEVPKDPFNTKVKGKAEDRVPRNNSPGTLPGPHTPLPAPAYP